jgi:mevalonate kinase
MGVDTFKICGAGGGGCLWALIQKDQRQKLNQIESLAPDIKIIPGQLIL